MALEIDTGSLRRRQTERERGREKRSEIGGEREREDTMHTAYVERQGSLAMHV